MNNHRQIDQMTTDIKFINDNLDIWVLLKYLKINNDFRLKFCLGCHQSKSQSSCQVLNNGVMCWGCKQYFTVINVYWLFYKINEKIKSLGNQIQAIDALQLTVIKELKAFFYSSLYWELFKEKEIVFLNFKKKISKKGKNTVYERI